MDWGEACRILGVPPNASFDEIKAAYRKQAKIWHPDMHQSIIRNNAELKRYYTEKMMKINEAREVLSDPHKRSAYDEEVARREREHPQQTAAQQAKQEQEQEQEYDDQQEQRPKWKTNIFSVIAASVPMIVSYPIEFAITGKAFEMKGFLVTVFYSLLLSVLMFLLPCRLLAFFVKGRADIEKGIPVICFIFSIVFLIFGYIT